MLRLGAAIPDSGAALRRRALSACGLEPCWDRFSSFHERPEVGTPDVSDHGAGVNAGEVAYCSLVFIQREFANFTTVVGTW